MPLRHLVYRCPLCGHLETEGTGDRAECQGCGTSFRRHRGSEIRLRPPAGRPRTLTSPQVLDLTARLGGPETDPPGDRVETEAVRSALGAATPVYRRGRLAGWAERAGSPRPGRLWCDARHLGFTGEDGEEERWPLDRLRSLQVASKALQVSVSKYKPTLSFELSSASTLRWEELLRHRIARARGGPEILEYQPRIVDRADVDEALRRTPVPRALPRQVDPQGRRRGFPLYPVLRLVLRLLLPLKARIEVRGSEHVPSAGPCVLVVNHQSLLDALVVQGVCPRTVRAMTKSTQFRGVVWSRLLTALGAFPVRRFEPDPQAVRTALRLLARGEVLAIYPEGERSWDGRVQPFRRGTLRLLLTVGVPVIPVAVTGTYDVWPRWSRSLRRGPVKVRFGTPLHFPSLARRPEREEALPWAARTLERSFMELGLTLQPRSAPSTMEPNPDAHSSSTPPRAGR